MHAMKNHCLSYLIKPPWKKKKEKMYKILMTWGSILLLSLSLSQTVWRTYSLQNYQIQRGAGKTRQECIVFQSDPSLSVKKLLLSSSLLTSAGWKILHSGPPTLRCQGE